MDCEEYVRQLSSRLSMAWNAHDASRIAALLRADVDFTNIFGTHLSGRAAVEAFHRDLFAGVFRESRFESQVTRVRQIRPDIAAVVMRWRVTVAAGATPNRDGLFSLIVMADNHEWSVAVMDVMQFPPRELATLAL
jgi:uncharacterized protein (TIGR02246 family)